MLKRLRPSSSILSFLMLVGCTSPVMIGDNSGSVVEDEMQSVAPLEPVHIDYTCSEEATTHDPDVNWEGYASGIGVEPSASSRMRMRLVDDGNGTYSGFVLFGDAPQIPTPTRPDDCGFLECRDAEKPLFPLYLLRAGFEYTLRNAQFSGDLFTFEIDGAEPFEPLCELFTSHAQVKNFGDPFLCADLTRRIGPDYCAWIDDEGNEHPVACCAAKLCGGEVCGCDDTGCTTLPYHRRTFTLTLEDGSLRWRDPLHSADQVVLNPVL